MRARFSIRLCCVKVRAHIGRSQPWGQAHGEVHRMGVDLNFVQFKPPCHPRPFKASSAMGVNKAGRRDLAARIYKKLEGARGLDDAERWQHALFFALSPQERCQFSLKTARSALFLRRSGKKK